MIKEDTIEKLSTLADVDNNSIYSKVIAHRPSAPMWCNWREKKNVEFAASSEKLKSFDNLLIEDEQIEDGQIEDEQIEDEQTHSV